MPKLVTVLRPEKIDEQARYYVRSHILLPAGTIGLVSMVGGAGGLGYQLLASHTYSWVTFLSSSVLLAVGASCGFAQARYHRYLFKTFPEVYAAKMRTAVAQRSRKAKAEPEVPTIEHPGRGFVTAISMQERLWSSAHQPGPTCMAISTCSRLYWCHGRDSTGRSYFVGVEWWTNLVCLVDFSLFG